MADRIHPDPTNVATMIENFNYEAGRNSLNMSFITGLGWTRQRIIVDQYAWNNPLAVLPPSGIPVGNIVDSLQAPNGFPYANLQLYAFPPYGTGTTNVFQLYDRWADSYNVIIEFVALNTARGLAAAGYLAASTPLTNQIWQRASASVIFPNGSPRFGARTTAQVSTAVDLSQAQILWDPGQASWGSLGQDPAFGASAVFIPTTVGDNRILQAEAVLPDGRRVFATTNFSVWDPINGGTTNTLDTNTVALYHFDDPSHPFVDATTNHYDLTMSGTVILATNANWMASPTGRVARFQNYGDQLTVTIPRLTFFDTNGNATPVSLEFEIYPRGYKSAPSGYAEIFELAQDYYSYWSWQYALGQNPFIQASGGTNILDSAGWGQYLTASTWHSIKIATQPSGAAQLFIDGNNVAGPIDTVYFPHYYPSTMPTNNWNWTLTIGNFDGDIDEVRISNIVR